MAIYKDKKSHIAFAAPLTTPTPACTATTISQDLLLSLQQFLSYLDGDYATSPEIVTIPSSPAQYLNVDLPGSKAIPLFIQNLYDQAFKPGGITSPIVTVSKSSSGVYSLNVGDPSKIDPGALSSVLYMIVSFHLTKQLQLISHGTISTDVINTTTAISPNSIVLSYLAGLPDIDQPAIYTKLKAVLIKNGFVDSKTLPSTDQVEFNKIMYPNISFGIKNTIVGNDTQKGRLFGYIADLTNGKINATRFSNPTLYNICNNTSSSTFIKDPTERVNHLKIELNKIAKDIYTEWSIIKDTLLQEYVTCLFGAIYPSKTRPFSKIFATGDGTTTVGVLGKYLYGVSMLNYDYTLSIDKANPYLITNFKKSIFSLTPDVQKEMEIRLDIYGIDSSTEHFLVKINGYDCYFKVNNKNLPETEVITKSKGISPKFGSLSPIADSRPNTKTGCYEFIDNSTPPIVIAKYNKSLQKLSFVPQNAEAIEVILESSGSTEEVVALVSFSQATPLSHSFSFELENLFDDDRFELTTDKMLNAFLQPSQVPNIEQHLTNIANHLKDANMSFTFDIKLNGYAVGKQKSGVTEKITKDTDYSCFRDKSIKIEKQTIPPPVAENTLLYKKLRYSYGIVNYGPDFLDITINSYTSPLRSRLDKRLLGPNLDGTGTPSTDKFDYRYYDNIDPNDSNSFSNLNRFNEILQPHTWYGVAPNTTSAFLYTNEPNTGPKIASYNQLLSALRCFGILEALTERIKLKGLAFSTPIDLTNTLSSIRESTSCETIKTGADPTVDTYLSISNEDYENLKWYTSIGDRNLF